MTPHLTIVLPFPPSVNHYWLNRIAETKAGRKYVQTYISAAGKAFKRKVGRAVRIQLGQQPGPIMGNCRLYVALHAPDKRRRDVDNYAKALLDSLTEAGVWADDSQIQDLRLVWGAVLPGGKAVVTIRQMPAAMVQGVLA
ncbi:RusA family crossover junction endodeoxyribonuclease [Desulfovibrio sp.]|uniref:RusA family crossover junction endodeoxyribonuclease n=1 Tax=Desulfovibrio sp. TaxID=885 RepID=UPI0023CE6568|nr:RusA family crossover junction endodeoxyribonuclease [Desulfovibrio sp.]MDE7240282.1 RusA family crossover junction endodeoxyribonuclease [Desulfovibrio sp.]